MHSLSFRNKQNFGASTNDTPAESNNILDSWTKFSSNTSIELLMFRSISQVLKLEKKKQDQLMITVENHIWVWNTNLKDTEWLAM